MPLSYTLNPDAVIKESFQYYSQDELELMTTYQLMEICRDQKIINGVIHPLDKDELIHQIMRFRGREDHLFITQHLDAGVQRLEELLQSARLHFQSDAVRGCAKLIAYDGLAIEYFDHFTIGYRPEIANTNALLVSGNKICAIFNLTEYPGYPGRLFITKSKELRCRESDVRSYTLYCMDRSQSDLLYRMYHTEQPLLPEHLNFFAVEILNFEVRPLLETDMPLAIDFGTSGTAAGIHLDNIYFEKLEGDPISGLLKKNKINYVKHLNSEEDYSETPVLPSVVGVISIDGEAVKFAFGYEADRLFKLSYIDEGFCVFYDLKRWVCDPEKQEEIIDRKGHRSFIQRKEIIRAYLEYVIECARQQFKCNIRHIHISSPVKQKAVFRNLFEDILSEYELESTDMLDEGVAVLYNSISELITEEKYQNNQSYRALIIDCGGGTTDLSSCRFKIDNQRVSYKINIKTAYENGDTDFGGNNLTYRIMQLIKISLAHQLGDMDFPSMEELIAPFKADVYQTVDRDNGTHAVYAQLDAEYERAEAVIPTRFKEYEHSSRADYYAVKNNFYYLFETAEKVKKQFYAKVDVLQLAISTTPLKETATKCLQIDRWKLSVREKGQLAVLKDIPMVYLTIYNLNLLLKADIYGIIRKFINTPYETGELQEISIMRLTGQSCKIDLFRDALKEFLPGRVIETTRRSEEADRLYELKLVCLNGAIQYLKDKKFGYADIHISNEQPAFPYTITAYTHSNEETTLIDGLERKKTHGVISRNMAYLTLNLFLKDTEGRLRYTYSCSVNPKQFGPAEPEAIAKKYRGHIVQDDIDDIEDRELKFFVFADELRWGFTVVPVFRRDGQMHLGPDQFFRFETEGWMTNFYDGTK